MTKTSTNSGLEVFRMRTIGTAAAFVMLTLAASTANAKETTDSSARGSTLTRTVADNVVVSPGTQQAAPAQPGSTVVVPQASPPPAQTTAVVQEPARRREVQAEVSSPHNYMSTIAVSALMGGLTGGLVGGAIYYLGDRQNGINIAYWAAGGVLLGTGVGVAQILVQESRVSAATASRFPSDPAPTYRLSLMRLNF
jgi:hypothetical protein